MSPFRSSPSSRRTVPGALLLAGLLLLGGVACDDKGDPLAPTSLRARLDANWDAWQAWTAADYEFDFQWSCFCLEELTAPVRVRVVDHLVEEVTYVSDGTPVDPDYLVLFPSIAQLFLRIEQAIEEDADVILVEFHPEHGYPVAATLDPDARAVDDELAFTVEELTMTEARPSGSSAHGAPDGRARE